MKTKSKITSYIIYGIATTALLVNAHFSLAGSATWLLFPQDSAWENANNWTPGGPPNGPSDIATFAQSSQRDVNISRSQEVDSIVFTSDADSFRLAIPPGSFYGGELIISGTGVINNSSVLQTFETNEGGRMIFNNTSSAGHSSIINAGAGSSHLGGGQTIFNDTSTAANASIDNLESGLVSTADPSLTSFNGASTAGHATITNHGADFDFSVSGTTIFSGSSTADSAILIANGGLSVAVTEVRFLLLARRRAAPREWRFLTMVTWTSAAANQALPSGLSRAQEMFS